jgi:phosphoenolpyruvate-protein phosphotransferase
MSQQVVGERILKGIAASDGIAIGPAYWYRAPDLTIPARQAASPEEEWTRFLGARQAAGIELESIRKDMGARVGEAEAAIFDAHLMMLEDPALTKKVRSGVDDGRLAEQALATATDELAQMLAGMRDELFAARALDVRDVGRRILRILLGVQETSLGDLSAPAIICAIDLTPSDTAGLNPELSLGFCTAQGGSTSHSAILARTLGIPAIVGLGNDLGQLVAQGTLVLLDGSDGQLIVSPGETTAQRYRGLQESRLARLRLAQAESQRPAHTADGTRVEVAANVGGLDSARDAVAQGAEGIGLLRTEFLYLDDIRPPAEEKQIRVYREIFEPLAGKPVIVRTLDIGGDKPPSYLPFPHEMNPFLGWRAIRVCLDEQDLFRTQLRSILQAAHGHHVRIMFPMINDLDELRRARAIAEETMQALRLEGRPCPTEVPIGIMVETPAAALLVDVLCEAADFFSLGTNDLTQYTLAVDRGNAKVAGLFQPLHPAVLRLIQGTITAAHARGKWVGMCGELAGMHKAIPILLGLGLDEFSMVPKAIPQAKRLIGALTLEGARQIANHALSLATAAEVDSYMKSVLSELDI